MKITIETSSYNERRYSRPYIGLCHDDGKVSSWGKWIGTHGERGLLEIDASPGDIVIVGQKDTRGNNGTPRYYVVTADGLGESMQKIDAVMTARKMRASAN